LKPEIGKIIYLLSHLKYRKAEYEAADSFLDEVIELYSEFGDHSWLSRGYQLKGQVYFTLNKRDKAIELFLLALEMANKSKDIKQQLNVLRTLGNAYFNRNLPEEAKKCFEKARDLSLTNGLLEEYAVSLKNFASIESNKEEKDKLLKEGIKVLEKILHNIQADPKRAQISVTIGSFYEELEDFKQALIWYQSAKTTYESIDEIWGVANAMGSIARMKSKLGQKKEAFDIYQSLKELLTGTSFNDLIAGTLINLGVFYEEQGDLNEAKNAFEEAEYLSNKYNLEHLLHVRDLLKKLNARMEWRKPDEMSYEQLVRELFELVDWFPEAKDSILRLWFSGRKESFFGNLRKNSGIKFMICMDNLLNFHDLANKLHPFSDLCLQVISEKEYPNAGIDMIPFPPAKSKFFDHSYGFGSQYSVTSSFATSKITGNTGVVIMGTSPGLPEQAHQLLLSTTADDLLKKKIFFLPYDRFTVKDKLETDADLGVELGIIPLYLNTLPVSDSLNVLISKDIKLPILSNEESTELKKQIRKLKHSILQLNTSPKDRIQAVFNDFIFDIENLTDDYDGEEFIQLKVYVLETINSLDNSIFTAFVTSTTE
jgi:tetratricopeptide (TPR) repeat protein